MDVAYRLYGAITPNVGKITAMMEEIGCGYALTMVDVETGEQHVEPFATINPNGKVPVLEDLAAPGGPMLLVESGAILLYLSERHGVLYEPDPIRRAMVYQWLMFQMSGIGPMLGQLRHFRMVAPPGNDHALHRYGEEAVRLFGVLDRQLASRSFVADVFSIADLALYPWFHFIEIYRQQKVDFGLDQDRFVNIAAWQRRCMDRPAIQRGMAVLEAKLAESIEALKQTGRWNNAEA